MRRDLGSEVDDEGMEISRSGLAKSASTCADCWSDGVWRARFLVGRWERRSAEVGMDSGIGSDMFVLRLLCSSFSA